jgi:hypothetical protein
VLNIGVLNLPEVLWQVKEARCVARSLQVTVMVTFPGQGLGPHIPHACHTCHTFALTHVTHVAHPHCVHRTAGLFDQAGLNAQMPCRARKQPPTNLGFIPDASLDAVVSVGGLARLGQASQREQVRGA